jgi:predicted naringenin-chalcone synthase
MAVIRSIQTAVPPTVIEQGGFRDVLSAQPGYGRLGRRLVSAAFDASAIGTRHVVIDEFAPGATPGAAPRAAPGAAPEAPVFFDAAEGRILDPGTGARNDAYSQHARPLLVEAGRRALEAAPGVAAADVTHVVTVSCTGFFAPGPDYVLVRELGLSPSTQRFHLGFMGCYGAFPALKMADQFCRADPTAVVLVVCVELCSLHLHVDDDPDSIVANSVFADGAAAAVVTGDRSFEREEDAPDPAATLRLDSFASVIVPESDGEMAWTIGDRGFDMTLSSYVPRIVERSIAEALDPLLAHDPELSRSLPREVGRWAVHPGGRSILDRVQSALSLTDEQIAASRAVLHEYGNMSSATVLFVLQRLLESAGDRPERVGAVAFGPGLTVESALMTLRPAAAETVRRRPAPLAAGA